ncbi:hypothetical protein F5Y08DRAFT_170875 [Xylaria arbuscula]|nr:hypothetical protein F5Y08DRAFT_170875 [Xylaria arbuscula]
MPSATQPVSTMASPSSRKRRRDDTGELQLPFNSTLEASQNLYSTINNNERLVIPSNRGSTSLFSVPRKAIPLPVSKKFRLFDSNHREQPHNHSLNRNDGMPSALTQSQQSHFSHGHPEISSSAPSASPHHTRLAPGRANSSTLLDPCHICHRKPTKKSDLDSFADCMGCGERTCYVCIRACQGWLPPSADDNATREEDLSFTMRDVDDDDEEDICHHERVADIQKAEQRQKKGEGGGGRGGGGGGGGGRGREGGGRGREGGWNGEGHRGVICSRCCVESGGEGDVICLGCLAGMKGA